MARIHYWESTMHKRFAHYSAALLSVALAGSASATALAPFVLQSAGAVELKFSGYLARSRDVGANGLREASFGAGYMTSIHVRGDPANLLWRSGQNNQSISFMMYGAADTATMPMAGSPAHQVFSAGCTNAAFGCDGKIHLDFYLDKLIGGTNPGFGIGGIKASQRQGFDRLGAMTDGQLLMRWEFVPGLSPLAPNGTPITLFQQLNGVSSPSSGYGSFLARCAGGPACGYFSTGMQTAGSDFYGTNTMSNIMAMTAIGQNGWITHLSDPVIGQVTLSQPATLLLVPLGAAAIAIGRRRRQRG
jgi:hypothetical protein